MNLQAGYGRVAVTPDYQVHISGYGDDETRLSQEVLDDICITCIALKDGDTTVLLYTSDMLSMNPWVVGALRGVISPATGVPAERIYLTATHSHSSPALYGKWDSSVTFRESFLQGAVEAANLALADLAPAQMLSATREIPLMNFVRHYQVEDGTYAGSNFGNWKLKFVGHATETDPRMVLVKFAREGKPDIVMMNWQAHNDNVHEVGYNNVSASYTGKIRERFEQRTGDHFAFFMGASGNQNCVSLLPHEKHGLAWDAYGYKMADHAMEALADLKPVTGEGIRTCHVDFEVDMNHAQEELLDIAKEVRRVWKTEGKPAGTKLARSNGLSSVYHANSIITRVDLPKTTTLELNAFRVGDMGFVTSSNEVFSTVGRYVRANAPYETTFILTGNNIYLPCREAYEYRSYEGDTSQYAIGTAERIQEKLVEMLKEVR